MKVALSVLAGGIAAAIYALVVGALSIQLYGVQSGAIYDLNNQIVAVTEPKAGLLQMAGIVAMSVAAVFVLYMGVQGAGPILPTAFRIAFASCLVALLLYGLITNETLSPDLAVREGWPEGAFGWIAAASANLALQTILVLAAASIWVAPKPTAEKSYVDDSAKEATTPPAH